MSTPTPRTDAASALTSQHRHDDLFGDPEFGWVTVGFARTLERELAAERARLDYLSTRGFEHRHHGTGDHLGYEWTISSYSESEDVTLRDVIDAEMREDEK